MTERARLVELLLRSLLDYYPGPATWRGNPLNYRGDLAGEVASVRLVCETCGGEGRARGNLCGNCRGRGWRDVDDYTGKEAGTVEQRVARTREIVCDSCAGAGAHGNGRRCRWCGGSGRRDVADRRWADAVLQRLEGRIEDSPDSGIDLLDRRRSHHRLGSYQEVEDALTMLHAKAPWLHSTVWRYLVCEQPFVIGFGLRAILDEGCERLAHMMPPRIRVPAHVHATAPGSARNGQHGAGKGRWANGHAQGVRNALIRSEAQAGVSTAKLAVKYQLGRRSVQKIVREPSS